MTYKFNIESLREMVDIVCTSKEPMYADTLMNDYLEEARKSWQYSADAEYREAVDKYWDIQQTHNEAVAPLIVGMLDAEMKKDEARKLLEDLVHKARTNASKKYKDGDRSPEMREALLFLMNNDKNFDCFHPDAYGGLTIEQVEKGE